MTKDNTGTGPGAAMLADGSKKLARIVLGNRYNPESIPELAAYACQITKKPTEAPG